LRRLMGIVADRQAEAAMAHPLPRQASAHYSLRAGSRPSPVGDRRPSSLRPARRAA